MLINTPTYNVVTREVTNPQEMADATKDVPITLRGDGVACKAIPNGDETIHFLNTADAGLISGYTSGRGSTLLKTTVPGIVYTVELICDSCPEPIDLYLPTVGEDNFTPNSDTWWVWSQTDDKWKLRFRFFYTPEFKPKNGVSSGTLSPGKSLPGILVSTLNPGYTFTLTQIHLDLPWLNLHVLPLRWTQPAKMLAVIK